MRVFETGVALQVNLNGVPHCLSDIGDWDVGGVHPLGVAMTEGIGRELLALLLGVFAH